MSILIYASVYFDIRIVKNMSYTSSLHETYGIIYKYNYKCNGPRTDPRGHCTHRICSDCWFPTHMNFDRLSRYDFNHSIAEPEMPKD